MINKSCPEKPSGQDLFYLLPRRIQHIFDENSVTLRRIADENMGDGADELSVLQNRAAAHE